MPISSEQARSNGRKGGRPRGPSPQTIDKQRAQEALRALVVAQLQPLTDAQIKRAMGIKFLVKRAARGGKFEKVSAGDLEAALKGQDDGRLVLEVWDEFPSTQAYADLMNRALDKPADHKIISGPEGGPVELAVRLSGARKRRAGA